MNPKIKKIGIAMGACAILAGVATTTVTNAATIDSRTENNASINGIESVDDLNHLSDRDFLKLIGGFTEADLNQLSSSDVSALSQQVKLELNDPYKVEVGYSSIAKAILKVWKKIPSGVKRQIAKYTSLEGFLKAIDHFTGTEEHIIYSALRSCHVPANYAHVATKIITLFI